VAQGFNKRDKVAANYGDYRTRLYVYAPARGVDSGGGVIRNPPGVGQGIGGSKPSGDMLWMDRASVVPFGESDQQDASRNVSRQYATIETHYGKTKPYVPGMIVYLPSTGESFTVAGVRHVDIGFMKVQLDCRQTT
jgi:hypothetical protein